MKRLDFVNNDFNAAINIRIYVVLKTSLKKLTRFNLV